MLKRFAAILLALSLLSGGVLASAADEEGKGKLTNSIRLEAPDAEEINVGDEIVIPITLSDCNGLMGVSFKVTWNPKFLSMSNEYDADNDVYAGYPVIPTAMFATLKSVNINNVADGYIHVAGIRNSVFSSSKENFSLGELHFTVLDTAAGRDVAISLDPVDTYGNDGTGDRPFASADGVTFKVEGEPIPIPEDDEPEINNPITDKPGTDEPKEEDAIIVPKFADTSGHWAVKYINDSVDLGLFRGDENGNFNPEQKITRAQFITVLWRMAGSPDMAATHSFDDVDGQSEEFQKAIAWGHGKGYVSGISDTEFDPNGVLTREAGMKMLHYYAGGKVGQEAMFYNIYDQLIKDSADISQWAKKSVYWGIYYELISGTDNLTISPRSAMTRAQMAKIMVCYHNNLAS